MLQKILSAVVLFLLPLTVRAFPDTIRHGYSNCTTCHVSPAGGGMLNSYGRSLSRELLSTWGTANEEKVLHGLVSIPENTLNSFLLGGDARYLTRRQKNDQSQVDEGFWMQAQLRVGLAFEKAKFLMALGKLENPRVSQDVQFISPEYYALYSIQENLHLRIGRFEPVYGLRLPDHNLWIKSEVGFVPWAERDATELIYEGETQFLSLAGFQSISTTDPSMQATGYSATFDQIIAEKNRMGVSGLNSEGQGTRRRTFGGHAVIAWNEKVFSLADYTRVWNGPGVKDVAFLRTGYEAFKGFTPFIQGQASLDKISSANDQKKYGVGLSWLPRPHFELVWQIEKLQTPRGDSVEDLLLFHYYL